MVRKTALIVGSGEMAKLIRAFDWAVTPLGPITEWPISLLTVVNLLLQSPVPLVILWGPEGIMIYNDAYSKFAGSRHPQLLGSPVTEGWPEIADFSRNILEACLTGKTLSYRDYAMTLHRHDEPEEVFMNLTYSPIIDESAKPAGTLAVVIETTERVRAERRQQEAERRMLRQRERLRNMIIQAPISIALLGGTDHKFILANHSYITLVGRKVTIGMPIDEALPELVTQEFMGILDEVYTTGQSHFSNEVPIIIRDDPEKGSTRYLNFAYQPTRGEDGKVDGILLFAIDVTDQVIVRQQVEDIANLNKTITDNATTGMMIMDAEHYTTYMNPAAEKITGYTFKQIKSKRKPLHDIVHPVHPDGSPYPIADCPTSKALVSKKRILSDDYFIRLDGTTYPVAIATTPIIRDGEMIGIVEEIRDTTHEKQTERQVLELNKDLEQRVALRTEELTAANKELGRSNKQLQDFAYVASHDLQEPLRKIAAFSNLLRDDYGSRLPEEAHRYLEGLESASARMRSLINDLLTYSRVTTQAKPFETIPLNRLVGEVLSDLQARIDETQATVDVGNLCKVYADPLQFRLLMQNLLSNALKYRRPGVRPHVEVSSIQQTGCCHISVKDNGIGFDERYLEKIFTIFQRLHGKNEYEGTGVGLAIVKKIVDRHNGTITAHSTPGEGSTFTVSIPMKQKQAR